MSTYKKIIVVSVLVLLGIMPWTKTTTSTVSYVEEAKPKEIIQAVPKTATSSAQRELPEILYKIALCESNNKQFTPSGDIVRGRANPADIGRFQINTYWNGEEAERLGYDLYTWEGNTAFALYLYEKNGTRDWNWSKPCWDRPLGVLLREKGL